MEIAFVTSRSRLSESDLAFQILAVDRQLREHFCPAWGFEAWPCVPYRTLPEQADQYHPIFVMDDIGLDALGFHNDQLDYIYGRVLTPVDVLDASTASHEGVEMRADPDVAQWRALPDGREIALETGDPVEADTYGIDVTIAGETRTILVSNFTLPNYFIQGSIGPWDYLGRLTGPAPAMTPGGYYIARDPKTGEVSNVFADRAAARRLAVKRADPTSRTYRRVAKALRTTARMGVFPPSPLRT